MGRFIGGKIGKVVKYVTDVIGESAVYDIPQSLLFEKEGGMTPPPFESSGGTEYTPEMDISIMYLAIQTVLQFLVLILKLIMVQGIQLNVVLKFS